MKRLATITLLVFSLTGAAAHGRMNFSEYVKRNTKVLKKSAKPLEIVAFKEKEPLRQKPEEAARVPASEGGAAAAAGSVQPGNQPANGVSTLPPAYAPASGSNGDDAPQSGPSR